MCLCCLGHRTFTESVMLCDIFGHICHAPLLVPFHGWRVSHRKHHENHNHVEHDHSWRPVPKHLYVKYEGISKFLRFSYALLVLYPIYLLADTDFTSGNHFNPYSSVTSKRTADSRNEGQECSGNCQRVAEFCRPPCPFRRAQFLTPRHPSLS